MRFLRDVSFKRKLMVVILLTSSAALLLACGAFIFYELAEFRKDVVDDLTVKADVIGMSKTLRLARRAEHARSMAPEADHRGLHGTLPP